MSARPSSAGSPPVPVPISTVRFRELRAGDVLLFRTASGSLYRFTARGHQPLAGAVLVLGDLEGGDLPCPVRVTTLGFANPGTDHFSVDLLGVGDRPVFFRSEGSLGVRRIVPSPITALSLVRVAGDGGDGPAR